MTNNSASTINLQHEGETTRNISYPGLHDEHKVPIIKLTTLTAGLLLSLLTHPTNPSIAYDKSEGKAVTQNTTCKDLHLASYLADYESAIFEDTAPLQIKLFKTIKVSVKEIKPLLFSPIDNDFDYA